MFGAKMRVEAEPHFEFVERLGSDARSENLVQPLQGVMVSLQPANAFLDRKAWFHCSFKGSQAGQGRQAAESVGGSHNRTGLEGNLSFFGSDAPGNRRSGKAGR